MTRALRTFPLRRLHAQQIARPRFGTPGELVAWLGAVQAQDRVATKWAVGLRLPKGATVGDIERALADGTIIRTHALRGTWQLVHARDVRWMLALVAPRILERLATRHRQLGLDGRTFLRSNRALERALRDGGHLTRDELASALRAAGISTVGQRLAHLLARAELEALICSGAPRGNQGTWALLERRVPGLPRPLAREEALRELALRYFRSRGPATVADFAWWSGLAMAEARAAVESIAPTLRAEVVDGRVYWSVEGDAPTSTATARIAHLLPAFDEYLVGYRDRGAVLAPEHARRLNAGGGMLAPCVVVGGLVRGTWRRVPARRGSAVIEVALLDRAAGLQTAIDEGASRYGAFLGLATRVVAVGERRRG